MARPLRLEFAGAVYHLTSRGNARQKIFFNDTDRELFLQTLAQVVSRYNWICHAYCLMAIIITCWLRPQRPIFQSACTS
jgi:REP element-mobilizing transposase RayT